MKIKKTEKQKSLVSSNKTEAYNKKLYITGNGLPVT